jgi:hypothetical protein
MSVARSWPNAGHYYSNIVAPINIFVNFIVDPANVNGLGVSSIKSNGHLRNIFMHTTATPGIGNDGQLNPNPTIGIALIQFKQNFNVFLMQVEGIIGPLTGSSLTSVTSHSAYTINALGTTTLAQWQAVGFPVGFIPAVGSPFVATATGAIGGTGTVMAPGVSNVQAIEMIGNPNTVLANSNIAANGGGIVILQFLGATSSSVTTPIPVQPTATTGVQLQLVLDNSSVTVDGL